MITIKEGGWFHQYALMGNRPYTFCGIVWQLLGTLTLTALCAAFAALMLWAIAAVVLIHVQIALWWSDTPFNFIIDASVIHLVTWCLLLDGVMGFIIYEVLNKRQKDKKLAKLLEDYNRLYDSGEISQYMSFMEYQRSLNTTTLKEPKFKTLRSIISAAYDRIVKKTCVLVEYKS